MKMIEQVSTVKSVSFVDWILGMYKSFWKDFRMFYSFLFLVFLMSIFVHDIWSYHQAVSTITGAKMAINQFSSDLNTTRSQQDETMFQDCIGIFLNNLRIAGITLILGLIPVLFLPVMFGISSDDAGMTLAVTSFFGKSLWKETLFGVLPHGVLEMSAYALSMTVSVMLSFRILVQLAPLVIPNWKGKHKKYPSYGKVIFAFVGVIAPMLFIAALIEAFITPYLLAIFS